MLAGYNSRAPVIPIAPSKDLSAGEAGECQEFGKALGPHVLYH